MSAGLAWTLPALVAWLGVLLVPWRPWSTRERLEAGPDDAGERLDDVTVLIPARDEAESLPATLAALARQGPGLEILLVDDQSTDGTAEVARHAGLVGLTVLHGRELPPGWTGKVWAQEQGRAALTRPLTLLLDADITLAPGTIAAMRRRLVERRLALVSLMAELDARRPWARLLLPAFVYFFKLLYPFALAARPGSRVAAAAGGCVLVQTDVLEEIGGFGALRDAIIDDCTLARMVKARGHGIWLGMTRSVHSHREYPSLDGIWNMVARTAYTQLGYSPLALASCTAVMLLVFVAPIGVLALADGGARWVAAAALLAMVTSYLPTLRFYGRSPLWALLLPVTGGLFLAMTWSSALRYRAGERSSWRGRSYAR